MKKLIVLLVLGCISLQSWGQLSSYSYIETIDANQEDVTFTIKVRCLEKGMVNYAASSSSLRCVMFNGIPNSRFSKPILPDGEETTYQKNSAYFDNLLINRYGDFIGNCKMISKFKKGGKDKSTVFEVTVHASKLRKDLEKNNIKRTFGI